MEYGGGGGDSSSGPTGDRAMYLKRANIFYAIVFIVFAILMYILRYTGKDWLGKIVKTDFKNDANALGEQLVGRTSFALALWFLIHSILCLCNKNLTDSYQFFFHTQWLSIHVVVLIAMWIACWFIPDALFSVYLKAAMYISLIYLVIQILILLDFFHELNEYFVEKENMAWPITILVILSVGTVVGYGVCYWLFGKKGCNANIGILTVNLIVCIIFWAVSAFMEHLSVLTASMIDAYVTYLTCMGLFCEGDANCNRLAGSTSSIWLSIVASLFTLCWAGYSAFTSTYKYQILSCGCCCEEGECCQEEGACHNCCNCLEQDEEAKQFSLSFFHILFALASVYVSMVTTSWLSSHSEKASWVVDRGYIAKWVNIAVSYAVILLYTWVIIAPLVCTDREFD
ncbi:hypothetical protein TVAG_364980 [Trichomonas vaginalis G3]|uniref:Serine incorporator n=1 Tax=Trichomonas vaginalis (strain ATCC PRA-98 / G3) TaxID=412133 RepID=A2FU49_TRIV3|nr:hypothetical protein TVAG_364980 [Trichomonas vaginalis G3]|eukprot:XP_001304501.1 hypothetical protein [Trichomonas vaginalis G3]